MATIRWVSSIDSKTPPRPWHIRPLAAADRPAVRRLFESLSAATRRMRFHAPVPRYPSAWWSALGRVRPGSADVALAWAGAEPVGHVMWTRVVGGDADLAVVVVDAWQGRGVARDLVGHASRTAAAAGIVRFSGPIHPENDRARRFAQDLGGRPCHGGLDWELDLADIAPASVTPVGFAPATTWRAVA